MDANTRIKVASKRTFKKHIGESMNTISFFDENKDKFFRYWVYRKPGLWTPYEQRECFTDEDIYEDSFATLCKITNYTMINEDVLLELDCYDFDTHDRLEHKEYRYLKDISLQLFEYDNIKEPEVD